MSIAKKELIVSALEASANLHLKALLEDLEASISGIFELHDRSEKPIARSFHAMGFTGVLPLILKAKKAIKKMTALALAKPDAVVLLMDSPAFNIPLAKALRKAGFKGRIIYYILPQVWVWKSSRVALLTELCDALVGILPFEANYWPKKYFYFGNPLCSELLRQESEDGQSQVLTKEPKSSEAKAPQSNEAQSSQNSPSQNKLSQHKPKSIAFLPGSRRAEIKRLMPIFKELSKRFEEEKLLLIPAHFKEKIPEIYGDISDFTPIFSSREAFANSCYAFICSGTATLEASLFGLPHTLCYKAGKIDFLIAKMLVKTRYIGLANIILDKAGQGPISKELLQGEVSAKALFASFKNYDKNDFAEKSQKLKELLSPCKQGLAAFIKGL